MTDAARAATQVAREARLTAPLVMNLAREGCRAARLMMLAV